MVVRLKEKYANDIRPALVSEFDIKNPMQVPGLEKVSISVGAGEEAKDAKVLQNIQDTISLIAGCSCDQSEKIDSRVQTERRVSYRCKSDTER